MWEVCNVWCLETRDIGEVKCFRHNEEGYLQSISKLDPDLHESQFGEWPAMCAVLVDGSYRGGGSLLTPSFVLTAAHKVWLLRVGEEEVVVRCGDWDTRSQAELYPHQDRKTTRIIIHQGYDGQSTQTISLLS